MTTSPDRSSSAYEQAQQILFKQILDSVRIALVVILAMNVGALIIPALQTLPVVLLAGIVLAEGAATALSRWLVLRGRAREGAISFVIMTLILATLAAIVLGLPGFSGVVTGLLVVISALLIGPGYAIAPGIIGILLFALVDIAQQQDWIKDFQIPQTSWLTTIIHIGFVGAALGVMVVVSVLTSDRLQQSAHEARTRAEDSERARAEQTALNERLGSQVEEQRRLLALIQELEAPAIPILAGVLVLPLVGHLDSRRLQEVERRLLQRVSADRTELVLVDITGVPFVDTAAASGLIRLARAIRLLGATMVLTGLQPATAQTLVHLGVDLSLVRTYATIQDALAQVDLR